MANEEIAALISRGLARGLVHPGDPDADRPPTGINLPVFRTDGMPQEYVDQVNETMKQFGEAVVHLIETEGGVTMVPNGQLQQLTGTVDALDEASRAIPVHCRCDTERRDPLAVMRIGAGGRAIVSGEHFIRSLTKRTPECPHTPIGD